MRVLFVTPSLPWPLDQGARIRAAELIRALPHHVEVDLAWIARPDEPEVPAELRTRCRTTRRFERSRPSWLERLAWPRAARWFHSKELTAALAAPLAGVDLVHLDEPALLPHWTQHARTAACLQHHKLESVLADALADADARRGRSATAGRLDAERWRRLELDAMVRVPHQLVCAAEDAARLRKRFPDCDPVVVENGVDPRWFAPRDTPRDPDRLLFLGSLDYGPNQDGLRAFLRECWPALREARPALRLALVGRGSAPELEASCAFDPRVEWIGHVDDVRPWLARCGALIVPLAIGGGTRIKLACALAMRTPVVTTAVGAEGLELQDGVHVRRAELGPQFTRATLAALDAGTDDPIADAGRERVLERYTWDRLATRLADAWKSFT
ncbi:MAG: glycosyltransferase [Planctomycetes bacterium]|nr:glycosyltransferase [Planctomycetota bacterium]MCB9903553.1 glycosyltransferase [Planctomycetota bacterium]